jgi:PIN domain nuclease of toxin-antitoxin system
MPGPGFASPPIWQNGWRKPQRHLREAPFTHEIVLAAQQLPLPHQDPANRFLAATAQVMDLTAGYQRRPFAGVWGTSRP